MTSGSCSFASCLALATPLKRRRLSVPAVCCCLQPIDDLLRGLWMLPIQCAPLQDPLDRFRHVQMRAAQGREEGHDPVGKEPEDEIDGVVAGEVIPDEQHPERRGGLGGGGAGGYALL